MSDNELPYSPQADTMIPTDALTYDTTSTSPANCKQLAERITAEMHKAIVGQEALIELLVVALLANGHVLLEGVPGTAKTLSVRIVARIFSATFSRIQFTPDLMPSDILGVNIYDPRSQEFRVRKESGYVSLTIAIDSESRSKPFSGDNLPSAITT